MSHFEKLLKDEVKKLRGQEKCEMTVTVAFTDKKYPTSVNMNAKCKGRQFFDVDIFNKLQESEVAIQHLCKPTIDLAPRRFKGNMSTVPAAGPC